MKGYISGGKIMKNLFKKIVTIGVFFLIVTVISAFVFAEMNSGSVTPTATITKTAAERIAVKDDFNHPYRISDFVKIEEGKYAAKAFNNEGFFGYIVITPSDCKTLYRSEASLKVKNKLGDEYPNDGYDFQVSNFSVNEDSLAELKKGFAQTEVINTITAIINGKDCLFTILNDGSYVVIENGDKIITHCLRHELLNDI